MALGVDDADEVPPGQLFQKRQHSGLHLSRLDPAARGENPAKILDTNWYAIKPMYEKKYRELIREKEKFVSINDIRLSRESVKKALLYLREIYRHRVSKTRILSLNPRLGETGPG